ncbi:MAG: hypothetical protein AAGG44_20310, partial [Planctomycetota bacterium]
TACSVPTCMDSAKLNGLPMSLLTPAALGESGEELPGNQAGGLEVPSFIWYSIQFGGVHTGWDCTGGTY